MTQKKSAGIILLTFFILSSPFADVLAWKANAGEKYEVRLTRKESVTGLSSITEKPAVVSDSSILQEDAAKNRSSIPYLHGVPTFPSKDIAPGDTWQEEATITYDLSAFGYDDPVVAKFRVSYAFKEMTELDSRSYCHIVAEWYPLWIPGRAIAKRTGIERISGHSVMDLLWDTKAGSPKRSALTEEIQYRFTEKTSLLLTRTTDEEFKTVTEIQREKVVKELNTQIATQKVANVEVKQSDAGIVLSIENIQFEAESAVLVDAEKKKLSNIGKMLAKLRDRKLNVVGHAANIAGSDEAELVDLSAKRAQSVADYLVQTGVDSLSIMASGMGGSKPLASNDTAEGRSKNRRVEIVIMDEEVKE